ncbi:MAG: heterodisulfide reductase-related iron-sulfur binding cluster [Candidatus Latescibacterota bacterium]|jgi:heterodisulfide reductase subunit B
MNCIGYFPGCSLEGGGIEYAMSIQALCRVAGVELREIDDWSCCGASAAHALDHDLAVALPLRVLILAAEQGLTEVFAPCAACFSRLKGTLVRLERQPELRVRAEAAVGRSLTAPVRVVNVVELVGRLLDQGLAERLTRPLTGLRVAPYYGCLLSRGDGLIEHDDPEQPNGMSAAIRAAGGEVIDWAFATECCGGGFSLPMTDAVLRLSGAILEDARSRGAELIVTGCPMCHSNLDMRQRAINAAAGGAAAVPVLYLSELLGLAAGVAPADLGLDRHYVDALPLAGRARPAEAVAGGAAHG